MFGNLLIVFVLLGAEAGVVIKKPILDEIQSSSTDDVLISENKTTLKKRTNNNQDQVTWIRSEQKLPKEILDNTEKSSDDPDVTSSLVLSSNLSDSEILKNNSIPGNFSDSRSANKESNAEDFISPETETNITSAFQKSSATSDDSDLTNDSILDSITSVLHDVLPSIDLNANLFEDEPGTFSSVGGPSSSGNNTLDAQTSHFNSSIDHQRNESELQSRSEAFSADNSQPVDNVSTDEKTIANEFVSLESHPEANSSLLNFSSVEHVTSIETDVFDTKARMISEPGFSDKLTFSSVEYVTPDALDTKIKRIISEPDLTDITALNSNKFTSSSVEYVTPIETDASDTKIKRSIPEPDSPDIKKSNSSNVNETSEMESDNIFSVVGTEMLKNAMEALNLTDTSLTDHLIEENVVPSSEDETINVTRKCPPSGICMFSFISTDECSRDSDCLDSKICCRIRCSKVCVQEH